MAPTGRVTSLVVAHPVTRAKKEIQNATESWDALLQSIMWLIALTLRSGIDRIPTLPCFSQIDLIAGSTAPSSNLTKLGSGSDNVFTSDGEMITLEGSVKVALHELSRSFWIPTLDRADY